MHKVFTKSCFISCVLGLVLCACGSESGEEFSSSSNDSDSAFSVVSTYPNHQSQNIPVNSSIVVSFNKPLNGNKFSNADAQVNLAGQPVSGTWTHNSSILIWHSSASLKYASMYQVEISKNLEDTSGNKLIGNHDWSFTTVSDPNDNSSGNSSDSTAPTLVSISPANNSTGVAVNTKIDLAFSEEMASASINNNTLQLLDHNSQPVNGTISVSGASVQFTLSDNLSFFRNYSIRLNTGIQDLAGNGISEQQDFGFETVGNQVITTANNSGMVLLSGGRFMMGADNESIADGNNDADELPVHQVKLTGPFLISDHEVTATEYGICITAGACNYSFSTSTTKYTLNYAGRENHPMNYVSWEEAVEYTNWLSQNNSETYRLCTEAEWEYAARAGSTTKWSCGNNTCTTQIAWYGGTQTKEVKTKNPNQWGLYDMHGNVREWVSDNYSSSYYQQLVGETTDPKGPEQPETGTNRGLRGGYYGGNKADMRSSNRNKAGEGNHRSTAGFRVCADP